MTNIVSVFVMLLFKLEFEKPTAEGKQWRWDFHFRPRIERIYTALILLSPIIFIVAGLKGLWSAFTHDYPERETHSSYLIYTDTKEEPNRWEAYKKF